MTVNVTIMLVITTIFISVSNALPTTFYMKLIEVFLLFSMSMPFTEVLLIAAIDTLSYVITISIVLYTLFLTYINVNAYLGISILRRKRNETRYRPSNLPLKL